MTALEPLGLYIHWPYCARICPYCDFNVMRDRGRVAEQAALVDAIASDIRSHAALVGPAQLVSIYLGGGTPSLMTPASVGRLIDLAKSLWSPARDLEITLEANPTDAEAERFSNFAQAGVNRLSLGVQALEEHQLKFLGRNHDVASAVRAIELGSMIFPQVSLDLIYALPGQTVGGWTRTLAEVDALGVDHISAYQLSVEPGTPFERLVRRGGFSPAQPDLAASLYEATQLELEHFGFTAYEVSNHARTPSARSRHNLVYWRGESYVGVGPGAHGRLNLETGRSATEAASRVGDYIAGVAARGTGWISAVPLDHRAAAEERLLAGLRIDEGVSVAAVSALGSLPVAADLIDAGFLERDDHRLWATPSGRIVLDRVIAELLT